MLYSELHTRRSLDAREFSVTLRDVGAHKLLGESYTRLELSGARRTTAEELVFDTAGIVALRVTGRREGGVGHQLNPSGCSGICRREPISAWVCFTAAIVRETIERRGWLLRCMEI
ncbi:hypothetical protein K0M31_011451 [Melipona bicolor]|uniref:Uncharacterized protein n=1 Tax=Melipona bicolor TaxID=60889 RepID=A0AA40KUT3_9HYME|nr:hypothetical protein K0M31_011451 [Melipona bicolor]